MDVIGYMCAYLSNNFGEWQSIKKIPNYQTTVISKDPMEDRKWYPFPKLFPDHVGDHR